MTNSHSPPCRYTVEILPYSLRAKGFTVFNFMISLSLIFNQCVSFYHSLSWILIATIWTTDTWTPLLSIIWHGNTMYAFLCDNHTLWLTRTIDCLCCLDCLRGSLLLLLHYWDQRGTNFYSTNVDNANIMSFVNSSVLRKPPCKCILRRISLLPKLIALQQIIRRRRHCTPALGASRATCRLG